MTLNTRFVFVRERPWSSPGRSVSLSVASKPLAWEPTISCGSTPMLMRSRTGFPQQVRGKDAIARLTLVGDKTLNGNLGREYRLVIGDLSGTARVFATKRRFYAAVVLKHKEER